MPAIDSNAVAKKAASDGAVRKQDSSAVARKQAPDAVAKRLPSDGGTRKQAAEAVARKQDSNGAGRKQISDAVARKQARTAATPAGLLEAAQPPATPLNEMEGDPNFMTSLARGLAVIQAFSQTRRELTISQISGKTGFSRAAVRRCLYTLVKLSFAGSDDNRHYYLRPRVLTLGHSYISSMPLAAAAQPILDHVSHVLRESCSIATLDGTEIVYIARANVTRIMSIDLGVGSRLPAYCTTMGRILLAHLAPQEAEEILSRIEFRRFTERTVVGVEKLRQILRIVQRNGYSIVDQELEHGLRAVAVPIRNPAGQVVAALNVGVHAQRVSIQELQTRFLHHLRCAALELCMFLR